jgi:phage regulator Rha-like protein
MSEATNLYAVKSVIRIIRNQRVILDSDLAKLYGVTAKMLNQAVKRNAKKFPSDFMFQLDMKEARNSLPKTGASEPYLSNNEGLMDSRSQIATLNSQQSENQDLANLDPKNIGKNRQGTNIKHLPYAFTEHGATMAAMVLNSSKATAMSVFIVRTFIRMREQLMANAANAKRLAEIEKTLLTHDSAIVDLYEQIQPLLLPPPAPTPKRIGFGVKEKKTGYRAQPKPSKRRRLLVSHRGAERTEENN